jgi:hypothetical protein
MRRNFNAEEGEKTLSARRFFRVDKERYGPPLVAGMPYLDKDLLVRSSFPFSILHFPIKALYT